MAWTSPMTAVANTAFDAADFNTHVRDNLNETMPALATSTAEPTWFVADGANSIVARNIKTASVEDSNTTTSTSYVTLGIAGPSVSIETGTTAMVSISCLYNNDNGQTSYMSFEVSGASSFAADNQYAIQHSGIDASNNWHHGNSFMFTGLTPGTNVFDCKYKVSGGTGTWSQRYITVWAF